MNQRPPSRPDVGANEYEIHVRGTFDDEWSARFRGIRIAVDRSGASPITILRGQRSDAAGVSRVFTTLNALRLTIVSVRCVAEGGDAGRDGTRPPS